MRTKSPIELVEHVNPKAANDLAKSSSDIVYDELVRLYDIEQQALIIMNRICGGVSVDKDHPSIKELKRLSEEKVG